MTSFNSSEIYFLIFLFYMQEIIWKLLLARDCIFFGHLYNGKIIYNKEFLRAFFVFMGCVFCPKLLH